MVSRVSGKRVTMSLAVWPQEGCYISLPYTRQVRKRPSWMTAPQSLTPSQAATPHLLSLCPASSTARLQPSTSRWAPPHNHPGDLEPRSSHTPQALSLTVPGSIHQGEPHVSQDHSQQVHTRPGSWRLQEGTGVSPGWGVGRVSVWVHTHKAFPHGEPSRGILLGRLMEMMEDSHTPEGLIYNPADPGEARTPRGKVTLRSMPGSHRFC